VCGVGIVFSAISHAVDYNSWLTVARGSFLYRLHPSHSTSYWSHVVTRRHCPDIGGILAVYSLAYDSARTLGRTFAVGGWSNNVKLYV